MLPAFPFKIANPLKSFRDDADLAEIGAFARFNEINLQIKKFYKFGAQFYVFHDGHLYFRHFLHEKEDADRYFLSMKRFIKELGLEDIIILKDAFDELKTIDNFSELYKESRKEMVNLWQEGKFSNVKIQSIMQSAKNNIKLSDVPYHILYKINFAEDWDLTSEEKKLKSEINERADKCAFEYMTVQHALEKANFFNKRVPGGIRLTVHPKEGQIGIYLVKRKTYLLPWMGVGVLKNNGGASVHYESELISNGKYFPVFLKGEKFPFYYQEAETIYQGEEEFQGFFDQVVDSLKKGDFYWAFAFHMEYMDERIRRILTDVHKKLAEKDIEDKAICREDIYKTVKATYFNNHNIQIKSTQKQVPAGVIVLKDRIINLLWSDEPAAYEIKTKEIVEKYQKYFKSLWEAN
jgi:pyoverdine/dityrosine biosynthesis protein Dit1/predicted house-cleaning noncanonical NTP pyrophosphatase (MazG superfamily)